MINSITFIFIPQFYFFLKKIAPIAMQNANAYNVSLEKIMVFRLPLFDLVIQSKMRSSSTNTSPVARHCNQIFHEESSPLFEIKLTAIKPPNNVPITNPRDRKSVV